MALARVTAASIPQNNENKQFAVGFGSSFTFAGLGVMEEISHSTAVLHTAEGALSSETLPPPQLWGVSTGSGPYLHSMFEQRVRRTPAGNRDMATAADRNYQWGKRKHWQIPLDVSKNSHS